VASIYHHSFRREDTAGPRHILDTATFSNGLIWRINLCRHFLTVQFVIFIYHTFIIKTYISKTGRLVRNMHMATASSSDMDKINLPAHTEAQGPREHHQGTIPAFRWSTESPECTEPSSNKPQSRYVPRSVRFQGHNQCPHHTFTMSASISFIKLLKRSTSERRNPTRRVACRPAID
jgi:hypothetical protein